MATKNELEAQFAPPLDKTVYTDEQNAMVKHMFMNYKTYNEIANATGVNVHTVRQKCNKWKVERRIQKHEVLAALVEHKKQFFVDITTNGLDLLVRNLKDLNKEKATLSIKELTSISEMITNIDKIIRLDDNSPTEIVAELKPATRAEIIEMVKNDPFNDIDEIELVEPTDAQEGVSTPDESTKEEGV